MNDTIVTVIVIVEAIPFVEIKQGIFFLLEKKAMASIQSGERKKMYLSLFEYHGS